MYNMNYIQNFIEAYVDYRKGLKHNLTDNAMRLLLETQNKAFEALSNEEQDICNSMIHFEAKDSPLLKMLLA